MPITETPTSPPSTPPEPPRFRRSSRYEDLDTHDLLSVIEDLEGGRNWAALREKVWIALIVHMIVFWFLFYGPKYIFRIHVKDPSLVLRDRDRQRMTVLELPSDALKNVRPKLSEKERNQPVRKPTLDRKTLDQLQAMRRAAPPVPAPQPVQPPPPQVAQIPQPQPPPQPLPTQQSQIEAPTPAPTKPNFQTGPGTVGQELQQIARGARSGGYEGDSGPSAPGQRGGANGAAQIMSDTMGVNFDPYLQRVIYDTKRAWYPIIPESARPPLNKQGRVLIRFKILPDGSVKEMKLEGPSGDVSLDRAAWAGITGASPFQPLPKEFKGPYLELRFYFLYNVDPGKQ